MQEAKIRLAEMIEQVRQGGEVTITRRGVPVARLVAAHEQSTDNVKRALEEAKKIRSRLSLGGISIRSLIDEGRR